MKYSPPGAEGQSLPEEIISQPCHLAPREVAISPFIRTFVGQMDCQRLSLYAPYRTILLVDRPYTDPLPRPLGRLDSSSSPPEVGLSMT